MWPRATSNQARHHGVLAPCARARDRVVPGGSRSSASERVEIARRASDAPSTGCIDRAEQVAMDVPRASAETSDSLGDRRGSLTRRIAWADLLKRLFEVDVLRCPDCGARMRLIAAITDPNVARRILGGLSLPPRAPPIGPATPDDTGPLKPSTADEPTLAEIDDDPGFDFDESGSHG